MVIFYSFLITFQNKVYNRSIGLEATGHADGRDPLWAGSEVDESFWQWKLKGCAVMLCTGSMRWAEGGGVSGECGSLGRLPISAFLCA